MSKTTLFYGSIVIAIIALALAIYYIVPGVYHPFTFSGTPTDSHKTHAIGFAIICVLLIIVALVNRPKSNTY
ncbi:MAG TPA: hypothetical protein VFA09_27330 [Ktedonobacteraceae bacterium]|jgi:hypothetical protein|nr:hypothetical protein [Ktedonobacteraceae bacterium]HZU71020.1 hypothetical protein [Ktedonobacteraceae bacterium]